MTPQNFIDKWRNVELKERTASQSHFLDLCHLLDLPDPVSADPKGDWFTFEKGASKTSGGEGWADVWRKNELKFTYGFFSTKTVTQVVLDPNEVLADVDRSNNTWKKPNTVS